MLFRQFTSIRFSFDGDEVFDLVVRGVRQNMLLCQICLAVIGPALDNLLGQCCAHAGQCNELLSRRRIQVDRFYGVGRCPEQALQSFQWNVQRALELWVNLRTGPVGCEGH